MTDHREVMRQALAYVEWQAFGSCRSPGWDNAVPLAHEVSEALRAALDEPAAEPVAWGLFAKIDNGEFHLQHPVRFAKSDAKDDASMYAPGTVLEIRPLYAHPPAPPASPDEDVKVVRLTREKYEAMCYLIDEIPALHIRMALLALLGDWPAQEGS
jgi:arylsulfatase A-like enzyme